MVLDFCGVAQGADVTASASYLDADGNEPDDSPLEGPWVLPTACGASHVLLSSFGCVFLISVDDTCVLSCRVKSASIKGERR